MLVHIAQALPAPQVQELRRRLDAANTPWVDGRATAGRQGAAVKHNQQTAENSARVLELGDVLLAALERNAQFISAVLPSRVYPPNFNRYQGGMAFGAHVDNAIRLLPGSADKLRADVSVTLFLSEPEEYDGGELLIEDAYGTHSVKLPAGDLVVYPSSSVHRVTPVTRGIRVASFFWVQSLVRDAAQRALLYELDGGIQRLAVPGGNEAARLRLTNCYHNLLRMWSEP